MYVMIDFRDGKSIKLIKQALAYGNKSVTLKHFQKQMVQSLGVWVGGDSGGGWGGNFGMAVRASILKPTPIIYLALKNSPFISLISKKDDIFIYMYCPLN